MSIECPFCTSRPRGLLRHDEEDEENEDEALKVDCPGALKIICVEMHEGIILDFFTFLALYSEANVEEGDKKSNSLSFSMFSRAQTQI